MTPNAEVDYIDAETGEVIATIPFYDPGLDSESDRARELKRAGEWSGPHLSYGCGRPLSPIR